jgi:hypothetical protein
LVVLDDFEVGLLEDFLPDPLLFFFKIVRIAACFGRKCVEGDTGKVVSGFGNGRPEGRQLASEKSAEVVLVLLEGGLGGGAGGRG